MKRAVALLGAVACLFAIVSCGGNNNTSSVTTPNGNTVYNPGKTITNRVFISNQYSGNLQIVNSQNDSTAYYYSNYTNTGTTNQIADLAVHIPVGISATFELRAPDKGITAVYDPRVIAIDLVDNATEKASATVAMPAWAAMAVYSPDSKTIYVPTGNAPVSGSAPGAIQVVTASSASITASYPVPSVRWMALSPSGTTILAFADNSDSLWLIDLTASTITPVEVPGFARPVNAFFSSDSGTAYVLNCGPQCGTNSPASVAQFDIASKTIKATVPVSAASVGLVNSGKLYVAGYNGGANGTLDVVDINSMTRLTNPSILINDGQQWKMALNNNQLYIGSQNCSNTSTGCLSIVDVTTGKAAPPGQPLGPVTGILSIPNRNVMYVIQGGVLNIYDTSSNKLQSTQLVFRGTLWDVVLIDQQ